MGVYRSTPAKQIKFQTKQYQRFVSFTASTCGWSYFMEDFNFCYQYSDDTYVIGIIDGYSGPQAAQYCSYQIPKILKQCQLMKLHQYQAAIQNLCCTLDTNLSQSPQQNKIRLRHNLPPIPANQSSSSGLSLIICILHKQQLIIGNVGDCKSYVNIKNSQQKAILKSKDHFVQDKDRDNIIRDGWFLVEDFVNGVFKYVRTIGNWGFRKANTQSIISNQPSVFSLNIQYLKIVILGSGGIWERPNLVVTTILNPKNNQTNLQDIVKNLIAQMIASNINQQFGKQNMTITVLYIK